jgi:hypothetical protein
MTARYAGDCDNCPAPIEPGDEVVRLAGGEYVHVMCELISDFGAEPKPEKDPKPKLKRGKPVTVCDDCHYTNPCFCV